MRWHGSPRAVNVPIDPPRPFPVPFSTKGWSLREMRKPRFPGRVRWKFPEDAVWRGKPRLDEVDARFVRRLYLDILEYGRSHWPRFHLDAFEIKERWNFNPDRTLWVSWGVVLPPELDILEQGQVGFFFPAWIPSACRDCPELYQGCVWFAATSIAYFLETRSVPSPSRKRELFFSVNARLFHHENRAALRAWWNWFYVRRAEVFRAWAHAALMHHKGYAWGKGSVEATTASVSV